MGRTRRKLPSGSKCAFCGGINDAETIEHAPPKILFLGKIRPRGLEFYACRRCNLGTSQNDQIVAMFAFATAACFNKAKYQASFDKAAIGVSNNVSQLFNLIDLDDSEHIATAGDGEEIHMVSVDPKLFVEYLNPWAAKLGCGLYFHHANKAVSFNQRICVRYKTDLEGIEEFWRACLENLPGQFDFNQGSKIFSDQFMYRYGVNITDSIAAFAVVLHSCLALTITIMPKELTSRYSKNFSFGELYRPDPSKGLLAVPILPLAEL